MIFCKWNRIRSWECFEIKPITNLRALRQELLDLVIGDTKQLFHALFDLSLTKPHLLCCPYLILRGCGELSSLRDPLRDVSNEIIIDRVCQSFGIITKRRNLFSGKHYSSTSSTSGMYSLRIFARSASVSHGRS